MFIIVPPVITIQEFYVNEITDDLVADSESSAWDKFLNASRKKHTYESYGFKAVPVSCKIASILSDLQAKKHIQK